MNLVKTIISWLGRFLKKVRAIMLDLGTALILIVLAIAIIGALTSSGPEFTDPERQSALYQS